MPRKNQCHETYDGDRCIRARLHGGLHRGLTRTWGFRDLPKPLWMERPLPVKDYSWS